MNELYLVCNAHLDPVWLWQWQEGATAAISTFRAAADFCEEFDGFVFCHNEALLYRWTKEYDSKLFKRIQGLVSAGKWHIMGGWYLQPDCNMPSGESILRQILSGKKFFKEEFDADPKIAVNFDSFGHSRGLVQILKQTGYEGYLYMRPEESRMHIPARNFIWKGYDGSEILAHRLDQGYNSLMGHARSDAEYWVDNNDEPISLFTWGVGNHGGGPSRVDLNDLSRWMDDRKDIKIQHSTPENFFEAIRKNCNDFPVVSDDLRPVFIGCYAAQQTVKQLHRQLENELFSTEKLLTSAASQGLIDYPTKELEEVQEDLMISEFHDALPGTSIESGTNGTKMTLIHGLDLISKLRMRGFMALLSGEDKAKPGEVPVFIYNPHPYPITDIFSCEFMPADQNWSQTIRNTVTVRHNGKVIPSQEEKPEVNMNLDWRKKIVFSATLEPSSMNRFDCVISQIPCEKPVELKIDSAIDFKNDQLFIRINTKTGLIDEYKVNDIPFLKKGSFSTVLFEDVPDPWHMGGPKYGNEIGRFTLVPDRTSPRYFDGSLTTVSGVRIVEDGPIRTVIEAEFRWNNSSLIQTYLLPKNGTDFTIEQRIFWNDRNVVAKLEIPPIFEGQFRGQEIFGDGPLPMDGTEGVSQKWNGIFGKDYTLSISNNGTYGSHYENGNAYLTLVRGACYAAHPIGDRPLVSEERFIATMDRGEHLIKFRISGGKTTDIKQHIHMEAQVFNEIPYVLNAFPGGSGTKAGSYISIDDCRVLLSSLSVNKNKETVLRLWNSTDEDCSVFISIPTLNIKTRVCFKPYQFKTFRAGKEMIEVSPLETE